MGKIDFSKAEGENTDIFGGDYVPVEKLPSEQRKKKVGEFFARMKRGYGRLREYAKEAKENREHKEMSREMEREKEFEKYKYKTEKQITFAKLQARKMKAKASVYGAAVSARQAQEKYASRPSGGGIDFGSFLSSPQQPQKIVYRPMPRKKKKGFVRYETQPAKSQPTALEQYMKKW